MKGKLAQIQVKSITKYTVTENVVDNIEREQLAPPKFEEREKEGKRHIERIKVNKNKPLVVINPRDKSLLHSIPIVFKGRLFIAEFPNLLTLYLNNAIESYNTSFEILNEIQTLKDYPTGQMIQFSNQRFYNSFLLNRINVIFYLSITLELLLNSKIPSDYQYQKKEIVMTKKDIEEKLPFKEKLRLVNRLSKVGGNDVDAGFFNLLLELYSKRSHLVHPKTTGSIFNDHYPMDSISVTFSDHIVKYIEAVIKVVDKWQPGLISFEQTE